MNGTGRLGVAGLGLVLLATLAVPGCEGQSGISDDALRIMVDSLLPSIAEVSGLEVRSPVRFALQPRSEARAFIERQLDEELGPAELAGTERAYKAFGLLADTVELRSVLLELLTEQVVGYYDPRTERLYVVEGASADMASPVVAHELVHALQDQHTDLDSLVARERGNDRQTAAQAAAEGQAMLVMLALEAARTTGQVIDLGALPDLGPMMRPALEAENSQFPVFQRSPRVIRETLLFPYIAGAGFVQALFRARQGDEVPVPFGRWLPQSTEQVMSPVEKFLDGVDHPTEVSLDEPGDGWSLVYTNTLGQLEISILLSEHLGPDAEAAATGWDGDRFALLEAADGREALVWYSVWDDDESADRFAHSYRDILERRTDRTGRVERLTHVDRPIVRVTDAPAGTDLGAVPVPRIVRLEERQ